jgi:hypothetical protein
MLGSLTGLSAIRTSRARTGQGTHVALVRPTKGQTPMHMPKPTALALPLLLFAACSGGGGGTADPGAAGAGPGSMQVVLDTTAGTDAFLQAQLVAVTLRRADGSLTDDLLHGPVLCNFADPAGEPSTILLRSVPDDDYAELHLLLAPGSAVCALADGNRVPVDLPSPDVAIALTTHVRHEHTRVTWLHAGHLGAVQLSPVGGRAAWTPHLHGEPAEGSELHCSAAIVAVQGQEVLCRLGAAGCT